MIISTYVQSIVDSLPPPTDEQLERIRQVIQIGRTASLQTSRSKEVKGGLITATST